MPLHHPEGEIRTGDCSVALRRLTGPEAQELFILCRPERAVDIATQGEAVYRAVAELLRTEGTSFEAVASETLFLRSIRRDLSAVLETRRRVLGEAAQHARRPVTTAVEQPPATDGSGLELSLQAVIPRRQGSEFTADVWGDADPRAYARCLRLADQTFLHAGNVYGARGRAFDEAYGMFCAAEDLLRRGGMDFHDVVRTWIYLRDMERDYAELNRARREFFRQRGIDPSPASTGIGGGPATNGQALSMSMYAIKAPRPLEVTSMTAPTLGDASLYGSDFARGLKVIEANKVALYVSGTASVDETGRTVHPGDVVAQADRMLTNVAALLAGQGASFDDVVSAVTYVREPSDAPRLRSRLEAHGFHGFPNALVNAPICRPDLLCETEVVAALPLPPAAPAES